MLTRIPIPVLTAAMLLAALLCGCQSAPPKEAGAAKAATDSLPQPEKVTLGNFPQTVLISAKDTGKPVLLLLHGGPGFTEMAFFRSYNRELDDHFIVVNWDQRGAGMSYSPDIPKDSMHINRIVEDAHELVTYLKQRFHKDKIYILGHSWGTMLGVLLAQKYPQDLHAFISVGQVVNMLENEKQSYEFTLREARKENNKEALRDLQAIGPYYTRPVTSQLELMKVQRKWLSRYKGDLYAISYKQMEEGLRPEDRYLRNDSLSTAGERLSLTTMWPELMQVNFFKTATKLDVPVYFIVGRHDYNTSFTLAEQYYNKLQALHKAIYWFERSAHMMPFEEPERFNKLLIDTILAGK